MGCNTTTGVHHHTRQHTHTHMNTYRVKVSKGKGEINVKCDTVLAVHLNMFSTEFIQSYLNLRFQQSRGLLALDDFVKFRQQAIAILFVRFLRDHQTSCIRHSIQMSLKLHYSVLVDGPHRRVGTTRGGSKKGLGTRRVVNYLTISLEDKPFLFFCHDRPEDRSTIVSLLWEWPAMRRNASQRRLGVASLDESECCSCGAEKAKGHQAKSSTQRERESLGPSSMVPPHSTRHGAFFKTE